MDKNTDTQNKHITEVSISYLASKIGTHLTTSFHNFSSENNSDIIRREINSLDFYINLDNRMQVFEKLGPPHYNTNEEMQNSFNTGVSLSKYINNELGEKLAKQKCLESSIKYMSNLRQNTEHRLSITKRGLPLFLNKDKKEKYTRFSKKLDIINALINRDKDIINKYLPVQDVVRLDPEDTIKLIDLLPENQLFYFVDINKMSIKKVRAEMINFTTYFLEYTGSYGYISYAFVDKDGIELCYYDIKDISHIENRYFKIHNTEKYVFFNKEEAIKALMDKKKEIDYKIADDIKKLN